MFYENFILTKKKKKMQTYEANENPEMTFLIIKKKKKTKHICAQTAVDISKKFSVLFSNIFV